jgi:hypothetical protein
VYVGGEGGDEGVEVLAVIFLSRDGVADGSDGEDGADVADGART